MKKNIGKNLLHYENAKCLFVLFIVHVYLVYSIVLWYISQFFPPNFTDYWFNLKAGCYVTELTITSLFGLFWLWIRIFLMYYIFYEDIFSQCNILKCLRLTVNMEYGNIF